MQMLGVDVCWSCVCMQLLRNTGMLLVVAVAMYMLLTSLVAEAPAYLPVFTLENN